jgi:hypothetical protein
MRTLYAGLLLSDFPQPSTQQSGALKLAALLRAFSDAMLAACGARADPREDAQRGTGCSVAKLSGAGLLRGLR